MVKYDHDISNNHQLTTLIYIFITDITTPDIEKRFCKVILKITGPLSITMNE